MTSKHYTQVIDRFLILLRDQDAINGLDGLEISEMVELFQLSQNNFISATTQRTQEEKLNSTPQAKEIRNEMHNI